MLKGIGGFAGTAGTMGVVQSKDYNYTTIISSISRGEPVEKERVPEEWYEKALRSRDGRDMLVDEYMDKPWLEMVSRTSGEKKIGELQNPTLELGVKNKNNIPDDLPDEVNGIPVTIKERHPPSETDCEEDVYDCVPGGANVCSEQDYGGFESHTGGILIEDNGEPHYITAAHGFGDCGEWLWDRKMRQVCNSTNIVGAVKDWNWNQDWAIVDESGDKQGLDNRIVPTSYTVDGHVTADGVDYLKDDDTDEQVHKYGKSSCDTRGVVDRETTWEYCSSPHTWVVTEAYSEPGDSGAPHYRVNHNFNLKTILGIVHGYADESGQTWASPAYVIHEDHGFEFGRSSSTC